MFFFAVRLDYFPSILPVGFSSLSVPFGDFGKPFQGCCGYVTFEIYNLVLQPVSHTPGAAVQSCQVDSSP